MREIRTLRAMWRVLETEPRQFLTGHEEGNLGYMPRKCLRATAPVPDPTAIISGSTNTTDNFPIRLTAIKRLLFGPLFCKQRRFTTSAARKAGDR